MKNLVRHLLNPANRGLSGMALDGPRGPYHQVQPGTHWLSQTTEIPVYTVTVKISLCIRLNNWDRTIIPLPFSKVYVKIGKPVFPRDDVELEKAMYELSPASPGTSFGLKV